jgi:predicted glycoside hydrolase/deacetylase ChbG (UPF0249 family)
MVMANKNYPGQSISENKWKIADIEKEFRAQIEIGLRNIPRISHISSHMNCAGISEEVRSMTKKLAREYKIDISPTDDYGASYVGYDGPHKTTEEKIQSFINMLGRLEPGKTYLFVEHPGLNNDELKAVSHIGYEDVAGDRQGVTDLFTSEKVKAFIGKKGIQLIGYRDLRAIDKN